MKKLLTFVSALLFAGAMFGQQTTPNTTKSKGVSKDIKPAPVKAVLAQPIKVKATAQPDKAQQPKQVAAEEKATIKEKEKSTKETSGSK